MSRTIGSPWIVDPGYPRKGLEGQVEYIQSLNRDHARKKMREWIDARKEKYAAEIAELERRFATGCEFCAGLPIGGGYDIKSSERHTYGLLVDHMSDEARCPKCSRCVAAWE